MLEALDNNIDAGSSAVEISLGPVGEGGSEALVIVGDGAPMSAPQLQDAAGHGFTYKAPQTNRPTVGQFGMGNKLAIFSNGKAAVIVSGSVQSGQFSALLTSSVMTRELDLAEAGVALLSWTLKPGCAACGGSAASYALVEETRPHASLFSRFSLHPSPQALLQSALDRLASVAAAARSGGAAPAGGPGGQDGLDGLDGQAASGSAGSGGGAPSDGLQGTVMEIFHLYGGLRADAGAADIVLSHPEAGKSHYPPPHEYADPGLMPALGRSTRAHLAVAWEVPAGLVIVLQGRRVERVNLDRLLGEKSVRMYRGRAPKARPSTGGGGGGGGGGAGGDGATPTGAGEEAERDEENEEEEDKDDPEDPDVQAPAAAGRGDGRAKPPGVAVTLGYVEDPGLQAAGYSGLCIFYDGRLVRGFDNLGRRSFGRNVLVVVSLSRDSQAGFRVLNHKQGMESSDEWIKFRKAVERYWREKARCVVGAHPAGGLWRTAAGPARRRCKIS